MPEFPGWYADTTLFADGHIEFWVYDPSGSQWGSFDFSRSLDCQPYYVKPRHAKKIDKIVCRKIKDCHAVWLKQHPLAEHVKVEC